MTSGQDTAPVRIGPGGVAHAPLGMGGSFYGVGQYSGAMDEALLGAMEAAFARGISHFDTANGYGNGHSERLIGRFITAEPDRREQLFLASKVNQDEISAEAMLRAIDTSRERLQSDTLDLYYIHWPRTGQDMRPWMDGLETARQQGKIRAVGVSNFSVEQMQQLAEVGRIDACQIGYNLLWRFPERDVIPYCIENDIAVVCYSAIAHGILAGRYARQLDFAPEDQRNRILLFREDVWPKLYEAVEAFKTIADEAGRSLHHLAICWLLHQAGVKSVLVSAKNPQQAISNTEALSGAIPDSVFDALSAASAPVIYDIPDLGNPFGYYP